MNKKNVDKITLEQLKAVEDILLKKRDEYILDEKDTADQLSNFKRAATLLNETPKQALMGMLAKHLVSISDMVQTDNEYPVELWNEKITDAMVYLVLLKALVIEEKSEQK